MNLKLKKGALSAEVTTSGAELISFRDGDGLEYIWDGNPAFWSGRNPVLFPIVGNLKNGKVIINGGVYEMNRHGFARNQEFTIKDQGEDFVVFQLTENEETLSRYPYPFVFEVCHRLTDTGFSTSFTVENTGSTPLPYCVGAHTAFCCPAYPEKGERFEDYQLVFDKNETIPSILLTPDGLISADGTLDIFEDGNRISLDYETFGRIDTIVLDGLNSQGVSLVNKESGHGLHMDFSGFPMIAFWTKPGAPYICLEPWHGCAAAEDETGIFEEKRHCIILEPGEKKTLEFHVQTV